ncbi:MAG: VWA domain-containing protein [Rhodomicrobium sp.]|nr:VWA domain-containing protein [Rhodomicrobium sp.]
MFLNFFYELKRAGIPVSVTEYLAFLEAIDAGIAEKQIDSFYYLSRASLVKDERHLDKFDRVFGHAFRGLESTAQGIAADIPEEWLRALSERLFTEEEKAQIQALGGWDKIMEELKKRLAEQKGRHQGGNKWIGTAGKSPYGAYGYNPVLLFFDVGGSMDYHIRECEELFSAARSEFKHMDYYYFHNCLYESVWRKNGRRQDERVPTYEVMNTYPADYNVIFVGDAAMSPYEILVPGGSVEHWNEEPGRVWLQRVLNIYKHAVWLNPMEERYWDNTPSVKLIREIMENRMYPLTLNGIDAAITELLR